MKNYEQVAFRAFKAVFAEVRRTERTNTRNPNTDRQCRQLFVEYGNILENMLKQLDDTEPS